MKTRFQIRKITRETGLALNILERKLEKNQNTIVSFIDLEKEFNIVNRQSMFDIIKKSWD